ncbi:MAG: hypothetical protein R2932_14670 [Caldilineaceae bacterium]
MREIGSKGLYGTQKKEIICQSVKTAAAETATADSAPTAAQINA